MAARTPVELTLTAGLGHAAAAGLPSAPQRTNGLATWYCCTRGYRDSDRYAAAGPALRAALGRNWRGQWVTVFYRKSMLVVKHVRVRLVDFCGCPRGRVIDLYPGSFDDLAPLSRGVISVWVA